MKTKLNGYNEFGKIERKDIIPMVPELINDNFFICSNRIKSGSVDLILTDIPYGILTDVQGWDNLPDLKELESIFEHILNPYGQLIMFCDLHLMRELLDSFSNYFRYRFFHIWKKPGGMPVSQLRPINDAEFILVFRKKGAPEKELTFNPETMGKNGTPYYKRNSTPDIPIRKQMKSKQNINLTGVRFPKTIIEAPGKPNMKAGERSSHPCQKPELLLRKLIRGYSNPGDLVFDPFAGSGSTLISAYRENRQSIGYEVKESYYLEAKQRIDNITNQTELFV